MREAAESLSLRRLVELCKKFTTGGTGATATLPAGSVEDEVLLVGGTTSGGKVHGKVVFLDKPPHAAFLARIPQCDGADLQFVSVCAAPGGFITSGGMTTPYGSYSCRSRIKRFNLVDRSWTNLPDMLHPRASRGSVCINNHFLTVGGQGLGTSLGLHASVNSLDLDLETSSWSECQELQMAVQDPGVTAVDNEMLVMGGNHGHFISSNVYRYDSSTEKRTDCQPMPNPCSPYNRTVSVGRYVFVLHRDSQLFMQYDTSADNWSEINLPCPVKTAMYSAMVLHTGRIVVIGGSDQSLSLHDQVQSYDIDNKTWKLEPQAMPIPLLSHTAIVVKMPRRR